MTIPVDDDPIVAHEGLDAGSRERLAAAAHPERWRDDILRTLARAARSLATALETVASLDQPLLDERRAARAHAAALEALVASWPSPPPDLRPAWPTGAELLTFTSIEDARRRKWEIGRERKGEAWAGEAPIVEAFPELLDCLNYLEEHERREGPDYDLALARELVTYVAEIIAAKALECLSRNERS